MARPEVNTLASDLIEVKTEIKKLQEQEKILKELIAPFIEQEGAVNLDDGRVYFVKYKGSSTFNRKEVIQYIREAYGEALADQIDQDCTKVGSPRNTVCVKLNN